MARVASTTRICTLNRVLRTREFITVNPSGSTRANTVESAAHTHTHTRALTHSREFDLLLVGMTVLGLETAKKYGNFRNSSFRF